MTNFTCKQKTESKKSRFSSGLFLSLRDWEELVGHHYRLYFHFLGIITIPAIDRLTLARLEGHFRFLSTVATGNREKLPGIAGGSFLPFLGGPAIGASFGFIFETFLGVKLLLACGKCEFVAAIEAGNSLVREFH